MNPQSTPPATVRILISSPGDVSEERDRARQVIEGLRRRYVGRLQLQPLLWEDLPLQADMSFQEGIDIVLSSDKGLDIAIFVLWSRLGSALGPRILKQDGSEYRSGTEREFDLVMQARRQSGGKNPAVLAYVREDRPSFEERLRGKPLAELEALINQKRSLDQFVQEAFHDTDSGYNVGAYHSFDRPVNFSQRLRTHLVAMLDELAGDQNQATWDVDSQGPPFLGLNAFQPEHAGIFFGREREIQEARLALGKQAREGCAFLLITGASGSGKSSLARAGVVPEIVQNERDDRVAAWRTLIVTPSELGPEPVRGLIEKLACAETLPGLDANAERIAEGLCKDPRLTIDFALRPAFDRLAQAAKGQVRLLLVLDQLEEVFAAHVMTTGQRQQFLSAVEALARSGMVWVLATARSDFYHLVQEDQVLARLLQERGPMPLTPPEPDALQRLIEEPARLAGLRFEPDEQGVSLAGRILRDASPHAEVLPLVEFVLRELFDQRSQDGTLTRAVYETLGGVEGAVGQKAEQTFQNLPPESQAAFGEVLPLLVSMETDGEQTAIRRWAALEDLRATKPREQLTDAFVAGRFFTADQQGNAPVIGFSHEAILRCWPRIAQWISANREFLRMRGRIEQQMKRWEQQGADSSLLLPPGLALEEGRTLLAGARHVLGERSAAFIRKSIDHAAAMESKARRRRRSVMAAMGCLTCVAIGGGLLAWVKQREADAAAKRATLANAELTSTNKSLDEEREKVLKANTELTTANASLAEQRQRAEDRERVAIDAVKKFRDSVANEAMLKNNPSLEALRKNLLKEPLAFFEGLRQSLQADGDTRPESLFRLAQATFELGELTSAIGSKEDALKAFQQSNEILQKLADERPAVAEYKIALATSQSNAGKILSMGGKKDEARQAFETAREIRRNLAAERPENPAYANAHAGSVHDIGTLLSSIGQIDDAMKAFESALEIRQKLSAANPGAVEFRSDLASTFNNLGAMHYQKSDLAEALKAFDSAREIRQKIAADHPESNQYQSDLAASQCNVGVMLRAMDKPDEASKMFQAALEIDRKLVAANPTTTKYRGDLAFCLDNLGALQHSIGKTSDASKSYESAIEIRQELLARFPDSPGSASDLGLSLNNLADVRIDTRDFEKARTELRQAIDWQRKALARLPGNPEYLLMLKRHFESLSKAEAGLGNQAGVESARREMAAIAANDPRLAAMDNFLNALANGAKARNNPERLVLAQRAYDTRRFALAARLWAEALESEPRLAEGRNSQHAYNAACAAALANIGAGDEPKPDEAESARLRSLALGWLGLELNFWTQLSKSANDEQKSAIFMTLKHWQEDSDLASIRDQPTLEKLPESERQSWQALWKKVSELIDKTK